MINDLGKRLPLGTRFHLLFWQLPKKMTETLAEVAAISHLNGDVNTEVCKMTIISYTLIVYMRTVLQKHIFKDLYR